MLARARDPSVRYFTLSDKISPGRDSGRANTMVCRHQEDPRRYGSFNLLTIYTLSLLQHTRKTVVRCR
jgi:hypothetical protein